jgi:hypothetical protein
VLKEWRAVALYGVALLAAISLDGSHIFPHGYYFIGTSIFAIVLMARVLTGLWSKPAHTFMLALLFWGVLFNIRGNVWIWARDSEYWKIDHWKTGTIARETIPPSYHLITDDGAYPLKMLYIGRSGTAHRPATELCNQGAYASIPLAIVTDQPLPSPLCPGRKVEIKSVRTSFEKWLVVLVDSK